jgi:hypothetical protein
MGGQTARGARFGPVRAAVDEIGRLGPLSGAEADSMAEIAIKYSCFVIRPAYRRPPDRSSFKQTDHAEHRHPFRVATEEAILQGKIRPVRVRVGRYFGQQHPNNSHVASRLDDLALPIYRN